MCVCLACGVGVGVTAHGLESQSQITITRQCQCMSRVCVCMCTYAEMRRRPCIQAGSSSAFPRAMRSSCGGGSGCVVCKKSAGVGVDGAGMLGTGAFLGTHTHTRRGTHHECHLLPVQALQPLHLLLLVRLLVFPVLPIVQRRRRAPRLVPVGPRRRRGGGGEVAAGGPTTTASRECS